MRVVSWSIAAPTLPDEVMNQAKGISREKALVFTDDRFHILVTCASEVERWIGRLLWPGPRGASAIVCVTDPGEDVSLLPLLPDVSAVTLGAPVVRLWDDNTEDWTPAIFRKRPAGRVRVNQSGEYDISIEADASTTIPAEAIEGVSRLFAYRETLRPGDLTEVTSEQQNLSGAMMKSGAAEVLRAITLNYL